MGRIGLAIDWDPPRLRRRLGDLQAPSLIARTWHRTIRIATAFWGVSLALVAMEATFGANVLVSGLYFLSLPALVGFLTWAYRGIVFARFERHPGSVLALGISVLAVSSVIVFVGLLAASNLKTIMSGV